MAVVFELDVRSNNAGSHCDNRDRKAGRQAQIVAMQISTLSEKYMLASIKIFLPTRHGDAIFEALVSQNRREGYAHKDQIAGIALSYVGSVLPPKSTINLRRTILVTQALINNQHIRL